MAEALLKIGGGSNYTDGDVLCAFTDQAIQCVHAQHLCTLRDAPFTRDGLRPMDHLSRSLREHCCQYRFERVSQYVVKRTEIATGVETTHENYWYTIKDDQGTVHDHMFAESWSKACEELLATTGAVFGDPPQPRYEVEGVVRPNLPSVGGFRIVELLVFDKQENRRVVLSGWLIGASGGEMALDEFIRRRLKHTRHAIYGTPSNEIWYGGRTDYSQSAVDQVWDEIETHSPRQRTERVHTLWPFGRLDIRHMLAVRMEAMTDDQANRMVAPQYKMDDNGEFVWERHEHIDHNILYSSNRSRPHPDAVLVTQESIGLGEVRDLPESEWRWVWRETITHEESHGESPPDDGNTWGQVVEAKRNVNIDWRQELLGDVQATEGQVLDREFPVGNDVELGNGRMRYESKDQVNQRRNRFRDKSTGRPVADRSK